MCIRCSVFFFKQKTAYEMRISDWSSDVCSSDLIPPRRRVVPQFEISEGRAGADLHKGPFSALWRNEHINRSEEHTSELQSLMRISYAVFCLKKKKKQKKKNKEDIAKQKIHNNIKYNHEQKEQ